jgi:Flp pilus assembly protein TadD
MNAREPLSTRPRRMSKPSKLNPQLLSATARLAELNAGPLKAVEKALDFAKKARELAPNDRRIVGILGIAAYQTGNFKWPYGLLLESARKLPDDSEILYNLAWASYSLGKVDEAEQLMRRFLAAAPTSAQSRDARLFLEMGPFAQEVSDSKTTQGDIDNALKADLISLMAQAALLTKRGQS